MFSGRLRRNDCQVSTDMVTPPSCRTRSLFLLWHHRMGPTAVRIVLQVVGQIAAAQGAALGIHGPSPSIVPQT